MATISEALAIAIQHHQAGRLQAAEQICRQILVVQPNQADAWHLLGVIAHQVGKQGFAVEYIGRAIGLKGDAAAFHNNLGNALEDQGKLDEAVACYRRAVELKPDDTEAHNNLGIALNEQGKLDEAVACYRRALELKPDYAEAHNNLGIALKEQGKLDEAIACYRRALELKPDFAEAHNNLGNALKDQGKPDEAVACYRRAVELKPDFAEAHNNLGSALKDQGKLDEAVACYRRALELKPDYAEAHGNLGSALEEIGDLRGAEDSFRAALRHNPRFAFAHYKLAELLGGKLPEKDLAAQRRLLEESELTDAQRLLLHFGLAQVLDARGEYAEAAEHLARGNALQLSEWRKRGQEYDPQRARVFRHPDDRGLDAGFLRARPRLRLGKRAAGVRRGAAAIRHDARRADPGQPFPGLRRGGDQTGPRHLGLLAGQGADCIEGLGRLDRQTAGRLASRHLERLRTFSGAALRIVDKMPENYLYLGLLASLFPRAKLIHCRRDLRDVAVSCWMTHFQEIRWANDQQHMASRFHEYQRLMEHWRKVLAGAPVGSGLRGDGGRPGRRGPKARGLVRPGVGAELPGVPPGEAAGQDGQRRPGPPAGLQDLGGKMEALRAGPGSAVRPAGKGGRSQPPGRPIS